MESTIVVFEISRPVFDELGEASAPAKTTVQ